METIRASITWPGSRIDVLRLFREPTPDLWEPDPIDDRFAILLTLDEHEQETGEITGIEVLDFLTFDRWDDLPQFPILWQLPEQEPRLLVDVLKQVQQELRREAPLVAQRR